MNWPAHREGRVSEEVINDFTVPQEMGYAESKYVSERLLATANTKCKVPISICRVGQIAGPVMRSEGMWNKEEWLPSLILSSQHLGIIPDSLGNMESVNWIPIDILSTIIMELVFRPATQAESSIETYHAVNPDITTWAALLSHVKAGMDPEPITVPLTTWVKNLRASSGTSLTTQDLEANPALKLVNFYESLLNTKKSFAILETSKTEKASSTLRNLGPVKGEWMTKWISQWSKN